MAISSFRSPDALGNGRHDLKQVADDTDIGNFEDRCLGVAVDRNDQVGILHTHKMLDRSTDTAGDIDLWSHRLTGLTYLMLYIDPAGINSTSRRTNHTAKLISKLSYQLEILFIKQAAAS